jgi:1-acyl-sn-glycerol-3-phosphate acyltransferase
MGFRLSLQTLYEVGQATVPTFVDAVTGRMERTVVDARLRRFGDRVVEHARMRMTIIGAEAVPLDRSYIYMSNHQSHIDIPVLYHTIPSPTLRMVAKKELFRIPIWGRAIRDAGMICVDRRDRAAAIASLNQAADQIADGVSIWIAPEGTRSRNGQLNPLKKGGFRLAKGTSTAIVPVALSGTFDVLPAMARRMQYDVSVRVTFGKPLEVTDQDLPELMETVDAFFHEHV